MIECRLPCWTGGWPCTLLICWCWLKVGLLYPISADHMVWTGSAPIKLVKEAGVDFDPSNGGRFRASTQAIEGVDNALEVGLGPPQNYCLRLAR